jgi:hypothetical protein
MRPASILLFVLLAGFGLSVRAYEAPPTETSRTYAFPSPARGVCVHLAYQLTEVGQADLRVYNERGNLVSRLVEEETAGWHVKDLGLCRLPPGVYRHLVVVRYPSGQTETLKGEPFAVLH